MERSPESRDVMSDVFEPTQMTKELLREMRKLSMQAMMETLEKTHPVDQWNLLVGTGNAERPVKVRDFNSYELALAARDQEIIRNNPPWTAVVRDKRNARNRRS